jgi:hypothetical protein
VRVLPRVVLPVRALVVRVHVCLTFVLQALFAALSGIVGAASELLAYAAAAVVVVVVVVVVKQWLVRMNDE